MSNMKCPDCGHIIVHCLGCEGQYEAYNPAELLRLIEKAETRARKRYRDSLVGYEWKWSSELTDAIKSYLSGDPSALEKLAGVDE